MIKGSEKQYERRLWTQTVKMKELFEPKLYEYARPKRIYNKNPRLSRKNETLTNPA